MKKKILVMFIAAFCILALTACSSTVDNQTGNTETLQEPTTEVIFDVTRFIGASYDDVIAIMGEPNSTDEGTDTISLSYHKVPYNYDGWEKVLGWVYFEFMKRNAVYEVSSISIDPIAGYAGDNISPLVVDINDNILALFGIKLEAEPIIKKDYTDSSVLVWDTPIDGITTVYTSIGSSINTKEINSITFDFKDRI